MVYLLLFTHHYSARCFGMNMPKSRDIQAKIPLPQANKDTDPAHHMAAATGRHINTILKVAKIFNIPVEIVTR